MSTEDEAAQGALKQAIVDRFESEAEPWRLNSDSGDRLAWITVRAVVAAGWTPPKPERTVMTRAIGNEK